MAKKKAAPSSQLDLSPAPPAKAPAGRLTVSRLTVRGVLGVEESTIDLDEITVLAGENATGKSSHLKALRSALGIDRTALARLARVSDEGPADQADEPSVEVILVGDDREVHVTRKGTGSPEVRERVGEDWRVVPRPVEWLRGILDVEAANPALWLAADDETRAAAVLAAMPLEGYSRSDALKTAGLDSLRLPPIPQGLHPLEDLEQVEAAVFNARTEVNRQQRAEHDAAEKLLAGLPAEAPKDVAAQVADLDEKANVSAANIAQAETAADGDLAQAEQAIASTFKAEAARLRAAHEAKAAELRAAAEKRIAELLAEVETAIDAARTQGEAELETARGDREAARAKTKALRAALAADRERLAALREQQRAVETDRHVRATADEAKGKAREHEARAAALTRGLEALKRYKLELAGRLPIKGLAVRFDEKGRKGLTLDGVPLAQVNDGRLVELATEVSLLRSRPATDGRPYLPLVLLDGIERLDPPHRAALLREVAARGAQVIAAVVGDGALRALRGEKAVA